MTPTPSPRSALTPLSVLTAAGRGAGAEDDPIPRGAERVGTAAATPGSGPGNAVGVGSLALSSATVTAGQSVTATVTLTGPARSAAGGVIVYVGFQSTILAGPKFIRIPNGQSSGTLTLHANPFLPASTSTSISATTSSPQPWSSASATLSIALPAAPPATARPRVSSLTLYPATVKSGSPATGTVTLGEPAPAGGAAVQLSCPGDFFGRDADHPPVVIVPEGLTSATFTVRTHLSNDAASFVDEIVVGSYFGGAFQGAHLIITP